MEGPEIKKEMGDRVLKGLFLFRKKKYQLDLDNHFELRITNRLTIVLTIRVNIWSYNFSLEERYSCNFEMSFQVPLKFILRERKRIRFSVCMKYTRLSLTKIVVRFSEEATTNYTLYLGDESQGKGSAFF